MTSKRSSAPPEMQKHVTAKKHTSRNPPVRPTEESAKVASGSGRFQSPGRSPPSLAVDGGSASRLKIQEKTPAKSRNNTGKKRNPDKQNSSASNSSSTQPAIKLGSSKPLRQYELRSRRSLLSSLNTGVDVKNPPRQRLQRGMRALKEIRKFQRATELLIPKIRFARLVREILQDIQQEPMRIEKFALEALQEAAEAFVVGLFQASHLCTFHAKRTTLMLQDVQLLHRVIQRYMPSML